MTRTQKIVLIIAAAVLAAAAIISIVWVNFFFDGNATDNTNIADTNTADMTNTNQGAATGLSNTNDDGTVQLNVNIDNTNTAEEPVEVIENNDEESMMRLAKIFVERYGSYSNDNNFENIINLTPFMTEKFQRESQAYIDMNQSEDEDAPYYGISTTAASTQVVEIVEGESGTVEVATRRVESKQGEDPRMFTQYVEVMFKNVEGSWRVNNIKWK